jgi:hypothetical protein
MKKLIGLSVEQIKEFCKENGYDFFIEYECIGYKETDKIVGMYISYYGDPQYEYDIALDIEDDICVEYEEYDEDDGEWI